MKPAQQAAVSADVVDPDRRAVESVVRKAMRAAAPDYYVQQATGRALTRFVAVVGGLQVAGVASWLVLVFTGVMDASMNLDTFMVSQLVVFIASIAVGLVWTVRHLKQVRHEAEQLDPGVACPMFELIDPEIDTCRPDQLDDVFETPGPGANPCEWIRPERVYTGRLEGGEFRIRDVRDTNGGPDDRDLEIQGLLLTSEASPDFEGRLVVEAAGGEPARDDELEEIELEGPPDGVAVYGSDTEQMQSVVETEGFQTALRDFHTAARQRDQIGEGERTPGRFTAVFGGDSAAIVRRSAAPLFPADDEADEATVDELLAAAREVRTAVRLLEAATR